MTAPDLIFAPLILPLLGAALTLTGKAFLGGKAAAALEGFSVFLGLGVPLLVLMALFPWMREGRTVETVVGGWFGGIGIRYLFDGLAWLVNLLGFTVAGAAWIYTRGAGPRSSGFTAAFLIQTSALAATSMTADLFNLFVCLEVLGISSYILVASSEKPGAFLAAFSYLIVSATAMVFFLAGLYGLYRLTGVLSYREMALALKALPDSGGIQAAVSLSLITAAVALRTAVLPLHGWLPDAHALAPHGVSAVLSGVLIKTPLFALTRVLLLLPAGSAAGGLLSGAGALTALAGVTLALAQSDAKRLLAYHSISQIGYIVCAWGAAVQRGPGTPAGRVLLTAAFLHAFYHALFKGLLFLTVGTATDRAGERNVYRLRGAAGILRQSGEVFPATLLCYLAGALAITAIPPLNGFASKAAISYALKGQWQYHLLFAAGIGTAASFIKLTRIFLPASRKEGGNTPEPAVPAAAAAPDLQAHPAVPSAAPPAAAAAALPARPDRGARITAQLLLAGACLATGAAAGPFSALTGLLLGQPEPVFLPARLYSLSGLVKTGITLAGGLLLYLLISTGTGKKVLHLLRNRPRNFRDLFLALSLGTAGLTLWLIRGL